MRLARLFSSALCVLVSCITMTNAQIGPADQARTAIEKGTAFLKAQQKPDGGWADEKEPPAITAMALKALVGSGDYGYSTDFVKKGYDRLLSFQTESGGIFKDILANYNTSIAISALVAAKEPSLQPNIDKAVAYLKKMQWTEQAVGPKGESVKNPEQAAWYGGFGYNRHGRPDLSNAQFSIQALHDAGLQPDDPAFKAALQFITRCQNRSESNDQPWSGNDGGFIYSPANGGDSEAESYMAADGRKLWRSYGTMTYAGLKSMLYAGVSKSDPRVQSAVQWIEKNYTFDENPGLRLNDPTQAQHGLYYYFNVAAKALNAYDAPQLTDAQGNKHDWRADLVAKIVSLQRPDGSWAGEKRWMEDNPAITTAYVLMALEETLADLNEHPAK